MKIKKFNTKLTLNKKTIANLGDDAMKNSKGGRPYTVDIRDEICRSYVECTTTLWLNC